MKDLGFITRILLPAAILVCSLFGGLLYEISCLHDRHLHEEFADRVKSCQRILDMHTKTDAKMLATAIDVLGRDPKLQQLWRQRDRAALEKYACSRFRELHEQFDVTHLYFHEPDRTCFLRAHQPDRHGDVIHRQTLIQSQQTGSTAAGMEIGPLGTLTLRVVQPWTIDGQREGYLELGEEITHMTAEMARVLNVQVAVLIDKSYVDREGWISGMSLHDRGQSWDFLPNEVVLDCRPAGITPKLLGEIPLLKGNESKKVKQVDIQETPYLVGAVPLFDIRHRGVGRLTLFENIASQQASLHEMMLGLSGAFLLAAGVGLLGAFAYLRHVTKLIVKSQIQAMQMAAASEIAQVQHAEEILPFRKAIDGATDAIAILGLDRQLRYINPAFENLFGYTMDEANAEGGTRNLYRDVQQGVKAFLRVSQGRSFSSEIEMRSKDGRTIYGYLRGSPIVNTEKKMIGILAIYTDLTERKSTERELLRQANALVECGRALNHVKESKEATV